MKTTHNKITKSFILAGLGLSLMSTPLMAEDEANATLDLRMRYEQVDQSNPLSVADALTLRTTLSITSSSYKGWSVFLEAEDVHHMFGIADFNDTTGRITDRSVIADPETTEFDQGYIQYKNDKFTAKIGRQVINHDGQRFVGAVAWRQDKQTFDGVTLKYEFNDKLNLEYGYITKRNRIFGEERDLDSKDHMFNVKYKSYIGTLTGYSYLLEVDNGTDNALDTFGISFKGKTKANDTNLIYAAEIATQSSETATTDFDATYIMVEAGLVFKGVTAKLGYESLGSDDGQYGFATPLATLHKFNGWSDQFLGTPAQGLNDTYIKVTGSAFGGKWLIAYHDFSADEGTNTIDDLGKEWNLQYTRKFFNAYNTGIKYANYSAGDAAAGKVDTDKLWVWVGRKF